MNVKEYLTTEKGVDASRIAVHTGSEDTRNVEQYMAPAGAHFTSDVPGTTPVDESQVKPVTRRPLPMRKHGHSKPKAVDGP